MIFSVDDHIQQIIVGTKTMTRRSTDRYKVGKLYAVQPCRTCKGIPEGKIYISQKHREWKPDLSDLPKNATFAKRWREMKAGYPIPFWAAQSEGGYTPQEFEDLYEEMHPGWTERWTYFFAFFTTEDIQSCASSEDENG